MLVGYQLYDDVIKTAYEVKTDKNERNKILK